MGLIKTSMLNSIAVMIKILTLLGINKLLAVYVGPAGYAALGQFQNAMTMITTFASGAINTGVTKYTAQYGHDLQQQKILWRTAGNIAFTGTLISALLIILCRKQLALWFLNDAAYASVFVWFAGSLFFFVFNALLLAVLNGKKEIMRYVVANSIGSILALSMTALLTVYYQLYGALLALAIYQSLTFFITLTLCLRSSWFKISYFFGQWDKTISKNLAQYTLMALCTALCVPISHIFIRKYIGTLLGWNDAGYWEAMLRLSNAYLMVITTTLSVYYLPRLSEINDFATLKKEIAQGYKIILPAAIVGSMLIYASRDLIIHYLFTNEFYMARQLFLGQVIGDILKIGSWILSFIMLSKAMTTYFVITEVIFSVSFYILVTVFTHTWGLVGAAWAYALNYLIYWITMYFLVFRRLSSRVALCA